MHSTHTNVRECKDFSQLYRQGEHSSLQDYPHFRHQLHVWALLKLLSRKKKIEIKISRRQNCIEQVESADKPNVEFPLSSPCGPVPSFSVWQYAWSIAKLTQLLVFRDFTGAHYIDLIDCLRGGSQSPCVLIHCDPKSPH